MFTHHGKSRTYNHNLKIASLLSFVAGIVNVVGFLAVERLTTNVTGHFAFFVDEIFKLHFIESFVFFLYILFFFLGSFVSSFMVEVISRRSERFVFVVPAILESVILVTIAFSGDILISENPDVIAFSLLFAMGLQNSLVTRISDAIVRTTHLTGLFTDLGIELSQLFFYKTSEQKTKLYATIKLRLWIICFFFVGGIIGGVFYSRFQMLILLLPATALLIGLIYDTVKFKIIRWSRKRHI